METLLELIKQHELNKEESEMAKKVLALELSISAAPESERKGLGDELLELTPSVSSVVWEVLIEYWTSILEESD